MSCRDLIVTFYYDDKLYSVHKSMIEVPMLVPGLEYTFETFVECISDLGEVLKFFQGL